jgi:DNA-binding NarL/FixJ family response regulator
MAGMTAGRPIRVLLVDDDALVRSALTMMLDGAGGDPGISVVGEAGDGADVPDAVAAHAPDVVLMDIRMPRVDGITATRRLRARPEAPHVIVLTTYDTDDNLLEALRAGADGFLLKDAPPERIVQAIGAVVVGDPILAPSLTRRLMDRATEQADARRRARVVLDELTPREREVALAVAAGDSNADIGARLELSVATVKAHVSRVMGKLGVTNRTQVALLVHDAGLG